MPDLADQYRIYKYILLPIGLLATIPVWKQIYKDRLFILCLAYMGYLLLSSAWSSQFGLELLWKQFVLTLSVLVFVLINIHLLQTFPEAYFKVLQGLTLLACLSALLSILVWYFGTSHTGRAQGIGALENSGSFSYVYGVFALFAVHFALQSRLIYKRAIFFIAGISGLLFLAFSQSRGTLMAISIAITLQIIAQSTHIRRNIIILLIMAFTLIAAIFVIFPESIQQAIDRGWSLRPQIWKLFLKDIPDSFLSGQGVLTSSILPVPGTSYETPYAHNAYIHALWQGGIIGLAFFLAIFALSFYRANQIRKHYQHRIILVIITFGFFCMFTDHGSMITKPRELYFMFWLPLAMLIYKFAIDEPGIPQEAK